MPWHVPCARRTVCPGSRGVVDVSRAGVREGCGSVEEEVESNVVWKVGVCGMGFDCGCQEGMRDGGTIIVERRLVNMVMFGDERKW